MAKKKSVDKKEKTEHRMGKHCGCNVFADGSVQIAPGYVAEFDSLRDEANGLKEFQDQYNVFMVAQWEKIQRGKRQLWEKVMDDYKEFLPEEPLSYGNCVIKSALPEEEK
ncbi:MAG: hypothetical protein V3W44_08720 [Dehalococcoidales bacterium]